MCITLKFLYNRLALSCSKLLCFQFLNNLMIKAKLLILQPQPVTTQIFIFHCWIFLMYLCGACICIICVVFPCMVKMLHFMLHLSDHT